MGRGWQGRTQALSASAVALDLDGGVVERGGAVTDGGVEEGPAAPWRARGRALTRSAGRATVGIVSRILARFAVVSALASACTPVKHPALDERAAAEVVAALQLVEPSARHVVAANGLLELERGRLEPTLLDALDGFANAPLDMRATRIAAGLGSVHARAGWQQVCKTSLDETFKALSSADGVTALRGACGDARLEQLGVSPSAKIDPIAVILALVAYGAIERGATVSEAERTLLAALAEAPAE